MIVQLTSNALTALPWMVDRPYDVVNELIMEGDNHKMVHVSEYPGQQPTHYELDNGNILHREFIKFLP